MAPCKNCETPLTGNFCSQCGQKDVELERPLLALLGEVIQEAFDVDGRAARTARALLFHPGLLTSEFLAGRRRHYSSPMRLYIVISLLFFVVAAWVASQGILLTDGQTLETDGAGQARLFADFVPRLMFIMLPVFALILKIAYRKRLYFDHLIHSLHLHSATYIVLALELPLERVASSSVYAAGVQLVLIIYLLVHFIISIHRVYRTGWIGATSKAVVVLTGYIMLVALGFEAASKVMLS